MRDSKNDRLAWAAGEGLIGASFVIWPDETEIAWVFFILSFATLVYWFFTNYRISWPIRERLELRKPQIPDFVTGLEADARRLEAQAKLEHLGYAVADYTAWDSHLSLTLEEAACLWSEVDPGSSNKPASYSSWFSRLRKAVALGELQSHDGIPIAITINKIFGAVPIDPDTIPAGVQISRNAFN